MSKIDKQLTGSNFCGLDCMDKQNIIHPETCVDNIVVSNESTKTLNDWLSNYSTEEPPSEHMSFTSTTGLLDWLHYNYPIDLSGVPIATRTTVGAVKIGDTCLNIDTTGSLGVNLTAIAAGLDIPTLDIASFSNEGTIKLGDATTILAQFSTSSRPETISPIPTLSSYTAYSFPVRIDINDRAGITIPTELFAQQQADWNQTISTAPDYIKNKPAIIDYNLSGYREQGGAKSIVYLNEGETPASEGVIVKMAANTTVPDTATNDPIDSGETTINEVLFYEGNHVKFNKVIAGDRQGLQLRLANILPLYYNVENDSDDGSAITTNFEEDCAKNIGKLANITVPQVFVNYESSILSYQTRQDSTGDGGLADLLDNIRAFSLGKKFNIVYYIIKDKHFDLNLTLSNSANTVVYKQYVLQGSTSSYCDCDITTTTNKTTLLISSGLCIKLNVLYNNGNQIIFIDSYCNNEQINS